MSCNNERRLNVRMSWIIIFIYPWVVSGSSLVRGRLTVQWSNGVRCRWKFYFLAICLQNTLNKWCQDSVYHTALYARIDGHTRTWRTVWINGQTIHFEITNTDHSHIFHNMEIIFVSFWWIKGQPPFTSFYNWKKIESVITVRTWACRYYQLEVRIKNDLNRSFAFASNYNIWR